MEQWEEIPNSKYEISNIGNIRRIGNINNYKLGLDENGYVVYRILYNDRPKTKRVHRLVGNIFIPNPDNLPQLDHINGNRADNRVENLRWCSSSQNQCNKGKYKNNKSGFKGVHNNNGFWRATIWNNNKYNHIGYFNTAEDAYEAYKEKALELHKDFCKF
jgi:hypothetical protein